LFKKLSNLFSNVSVSKNKLCGNSSVKRKNIILNELMKIEIKTV